MAKKPPQPLNQYVPRHDRPDNRGTQGANPPRPPIVVMPEIHKLPVVPDNTYPHVPAKPLPAQKGQTAPRKPRK